MDRTPHGALPDRLRRVVKTAVRSGRRIAVSAQGERQRPPA